MNVSSAAGNVDDIVAMKRDWSLGVLYLCEQPEVLIRVRLCKCIVQAFAVQRKRAGDLSSDVRDRGPSTPASSRSFRLSLLPSVQVR